MIVMTNSSPRDGGMNADLKVDLQIASEAGDLPSTRDLQHWAACAYQGDTPCEVTIRIVDEQEGTELNGRYRGRHYATNVLSFPFEAPPGITVPLLGDLVICAPVVAREAQEQHKSSFAHWAHMVIHGMLHLQGYDHEEEAQATVMEGLEVALLAALDIPNPYGTEELEQDQ